ncbi:MAG: endonuclease/exonuclease/phosphatase family protein [Deltaproteobacteria bacterium]|nr:endonuclease/exonuclease/phosphatase family protein [Deltaproteobacteria bacterium]
MWTLVLVLTFFLLISGSLVHANPAPPLKCVSFNLLHGGVFSGLTGETQDLDRRLSMVVKELRRLEPDILGLQEASTGRSRGNVAQRLAAQLGFHYVYAPASFRVFTSERANAVAAWVMNLTEGPAIVSRFPIVSWTAHDLPRCGRWTDPRVLLTADVQTPWGMLRVGSTHISGNTCQAEAVASVIQQQQNSLPLLLLGDFNAHEHTPAITHLTQKLGLIDTFRLMNPTTPGLTVWQRVEATAPTVFRRVDYVFFLPGKAFPGSVRSSRVILNTPHQLPDGRTLWPSDHFGVLSEVEAFPDANSTQPQPGGRGQNPMLR